MTAAYDKAWSRLQRGAVMILDGGISSELERRGATMSDGLWSGRVALDHWQAVVDMHCAYLDAGADVVTTNTFASSRIMLEASGLGDQTREINQRAIEAALVAREKSGRADVLVAGSLSHMFPILSDGQRPGGRSKPGDAEMLGAFQELAEINASEGSDLILLEMMRGPERMAQVFQALQGISCPVWCGLSAGRAKDGSLDAAWHEADVAFTDILHHAAAQNFDVLGVMHSQPDVIDEALPMITNRHDGPVMAYPDAGHFEMPHWHFSKTIAPERFAQFTEGWLALGAQIIGGCCGLGPEHIAAIAHLKDQSHHALSTRS
ncbi:MAG: homocysteine S-methyltransferase family protein [Pseudomonadota bacterium]